jgi:hypothetical protein
LFIIFFTKVSSWLNLRHGLLAERPEHDEEGVGQLLRVLRRVDDPGVDPDDHVTPVRVAYLTKEHS